MPRKILIILFFYIVFSSSTTTIVECLLWYSNMYGVCCFGLFFMTILAIIWHEAHTANFNYCLLFTKFTANFAPSHRHRHMAVAAVVWIESSCIKIRSIWPVRCEAVLVQLIYYITWYLIVLFCKVQRWICNAVLSKLEFGGVLHASTSNSHQCNWAACAYDYTHLVFCSH